MVEVHEVDLLIIGSGIYGIAALRTYVEIHPNDKVIILEADDQPGGVWSAGRLYDTFWTQTPLGTTEFSDSALTGLSFNESYHGYFPAVHVANYLRDYITDLHYGGTKLIDRFKWCSRVSSLKKLGGRWHATIEKTGAVYIAPKVIDATGQSSNPNVPDIPGKETFQGQLIHHKQLGLSKVLEGTAGRSLVVIGGAKSAADVAYAAAKAGKKVTWLIRKTGSGPAAFSPPTAPVMLYRNSNEAFHNRFMALFATSIFSDSSSWAQRIVHCTPPGRRILKRVWATVQKGIEKLARYDRPEGLQNGFQNLRPDTAIFWENDSSGVVQHPDFYDTIARHVRVYRQDIDKLSKTELVLADGTRIEADSIVFATGWKYSSPHFEPSTAAHLGLSTPISALDPREEVKWYDLEKKADTEVLKRFPILANAPACYQPKIEDTPFRLYKSIVPIYDRSIAFLGKVTLGNNFYNAEVQAIYAIAALDGTNPLPSPPAMEEEIARVVAWNRRRYLAKGERGNWFYWDLVPYTDALLKEVGLSSHRKKGWMDLLTPALASDLQGIIAEYKSRLNNVEGNSTT